MLRMCYDPRIGMPVHSAGHACVNVLWLQIVNIQATDMAAKCGENNSLGSINEALPWYLKVDSHTWQVRRAG